MKKLTINCKGTMEISLDQIHLVQGDLKSLNNANFNKLKGQLMEHGFFVPFFITKLGNSFYLLDGHQRYRVLTELSDNKELEIPDKFPAVLINSKSVDDAKKKLLAITSQYGKITNDSFSYFTSDLDMKLEDCFNFDAFNIDKLFNNDKDINPNKSSEIEIEDDFSSKDFSSKDESFSKVICPHCNKDFTYP